MSEKAIREYLKTINTDNSGLIDLFYPVGSYYETSDVNFNPNTAWGGTWVEEVAGQVHISAGTGYSVSGALTNTSDGGESTVTLDTTQIPAHTHGNKSLTGSFRLLGWSSYTASGIVSKNSYNYNDRTASSGSNFGAKGLDIDASHEHNSVGGGQAHNNLQPYIVVKRWHRTA